MSSMSSDHPQLKTDHWTSLEQYNGLPIPDTAVETGFSRRHFLRIMGASIALAGLAGCRRPVEKIVPYVTQPEEVILGVPAYYASTMPFGVDAYGILVESHEGRPTKIEGNKLHPSTLGGSSAFVQASILGMYDPDRSKRILHKGQTKEWAEFVEFWRGIEPSYSRNGGQGLAVISESFSSPTLARLKRLFDDRYPNADWVTYEPVSDENIFKGIELATGNRYRPRYDFSKAKIIVALDSDFLLMESGSIANAKGFIDSRRVTSVNDAMNRLYVAESGYSITGAMADHRIAVPSSEIGSFLTALVLELESRGVVTGLKDALSKSHAEGFDRGLLNAMVADLISHSGESLIVAGRRQPPIVHALVVALNHALGNVGKTVEYIETTDVALPDRIRLASLTRKMSDGDISTLVIIGGNPVFNAPSDLDFAGSLKRVDHTAHLSMYEDETSMATQWQISRTHYLETWGDCRSGDGTLSVIQPLIAPLYNSKADLELLNLLATGTDKRGYDIARETWRDILNNGDFEANWRRVLNDGLLKDSALPPVDIKPQSATISNQLAENPFPKAALGSNNLEIVFRADHHVYDGRFANNAWLQEMPDPVTKLVWDNAALISPTLSEALHMHNEDMVMLRLGDRNLQMPVWIVPGQADNSVTVTLGYGRRRTGRVGKGAGFDTYGLRTSDYPDFALGLSMEKTGKRYTLSCTQDHHQMEGRPLIRAATLEEYRKSPDFAPKTLEIPPLHSLWKEHTYAEGYQWGMAIDLNACIGCNACVIACQSENNVPVVGKRQAGYGREMQWIRIDRYFEGDPRHPRMVFQPMPCQQCEMAPCEQVCPVAATNHDKEGLNLMVYNRCVGTRYCSNNCPYKVRRFNFFNYISAYPSTVKMVQNPDVTVRSRGVMEKCSYCLQRINRAKMRAKSEGRQVKDGEIMTACQQACPTGAIIFGNILDKISVVAARKSDNRNYQILGEFNTRPRTSYLAKLRNPNSKLDQSPSSSTESHS
jgi:Fe-S-cluster-containing dehydrogenase component